MLAVNKTPCFFIDDSLKNKGNVLYFLYFYTINYNGKQDNFKTQDHFPLLILSVSRGDRKLRSLRGAYFTG